MCDESDRRRRAVLRDGLSREKPSGSHHTTRHDESTISFWPSVSYFVLVAFISREGDHAFPSGLVSHFTAYDVFGTTAIVQRSSYVFPFDAVPLLDQVQLFALFVSVACADDPPIKSCQVPVYFFAPGS